VESIVLLAKFIKPLLLTRVAAGAATRVTADAQASDTHPPTVAEKQISATDEARFVAERSSSSG
jgi:hypothetical protein